VETRAWRLERANRPCGAWPFSDWRALLAHHALQIVDTVLAKLFAWGEKTTDLFALLDESDVVVYPEVEPVFRATGQYSALCKVYSKLGDDAALLEALSKYVALSFWFSRAFATYRQFVRLVEGEWTDPEIPDPLSDMFALLTARRDRALTQQWGVWLAGKDTERALKVGPTYFTPIAYHSGI
jgi:hypothetical protein